MKDAGRRGSDGPEPPFIEFPSAAVQPVEPVIRA